VNHDTGKNNFSALLLSLPIEERLIIVCCQKHSPDLSISEILQVSASELKSLDYDRLYNLSSLNGVLPLIYNRSKQFNIFPAEFINKLHFEYLKTAATNLLQSQELIRIIQVLNNADIDVIPLKGPVAAENIFGDVGLYPFSDLDILVRTADLDKSGELLKQEAGYVMPEDIGKTLLSDHYHYIYSNGRHSLEVHWNLVKRYYQIPEGFWWEGTGQGDFQGITITELEPEKYLLYLIFRLFDHQFSPMRFMVLAAEFINSQKGDINWKKFIGYAEKYRMTRLVHFVLKLLGELLASNVPEQFIKKRILGYEYLSKSVVAGFFQGEQRAHLNMLAYISLLDSPPAVIGTTLSRIFPSAGEIRLRYGISHGDTLKTLFYYVLNPFLLVFRKK